ncbi:MAG: hypothetical protein ACOCZE_04955, partial [Planctomycetota bacterium]
MKDHHVTPVVSALCLLLVGLLPAAGCRESTATMRLYQDVEVGKVLPGRMQANRLAAHSRFGLTRVIYEPSASPNFEKLEVYRIAVAHSRVVAKDYIFRQGGLVAGDKRVKYRRVIEAELPEHAFEPMPATWDPIGRTETLPIISAMIEDAQPSRAYPHRRKPPEDFIDLRNYYFDELASRVYARSLAAALANQASAAVSLPEDQQDVDEQIELRTRQYSRMLAANQREIQITEEQLIRINYNYEFAEEPAEKERWLDLKEGLEAKVQTLQDANAQIEALIQTAAGQKNSALATARWQAAHGLAADRSRRALEAMQGNVAGYILSMADLLERLPSQPLPSPRIWKGKAFSDLWPRYELVSALQGSALDKVTADEADHTVTLPTGVTVRTTNLGDHRIRVEIS